MATKTKKWYQSKTIWFNVVTFILGGFGALDTAMMPEWFPEALVGINVIGNIILRKLTSTRLQ